MLEGLRAALNGELIELGLLTDPEDAEAKIPSLRAASRSRLVPAMRWWAVGMRHDDIDRDRKPGMTAGQVPRPRRLPVPCDDDV